MQTLKEARLYADDLIDDGKTQYHMLDEYEKCVLTGHIINSTDKFHIWEYITEADYKNELPYILSKWLVDDSHHYPFELATIMKKNALEYASKEAIRILEEQLHEWELDKKFNNE
jgi:hypothetical protein